MHERLTCLALDMATEQQNVRILFVLGLLLHFVGFLEFTSVVYKANW